MSGVEVGWLGEVGVGSGGRRMGGVEGRWVKCG